MAKYFLTFNISLTFVKWLRIFSGSPMENPFYGYGRGHLLTRSETETQKIKMPTFASRHTPKIK